MTTARGGARRRELFLPFSKPTIEDDEVAEVVDSLRSGWITTGPKVQQFEAAFRERLVSPHAVAVNSATAGLHLAVAALDLAPTDEVIVPSLTWASTANVVELCGARTVFCDVDPNTLCIDVADAARRVTPRTRAVIPVHFAGQPADLDALRALCRDRGLALIEDAAHALGTAYRGVEIGRESDVAVFSFHAIKNITTGEGGMIVCRDAALAERLRLLRFHGVSKDAWKRYQRGGSPRFEVVEPGWKYNMLDLQAALGLRQLAKLERFNARRAALAARYQRLLAGVPELAPLAPVAWPGAHAWHLYIVRLDLDAVTLDRDEFMAALQEENVGTGLHFPPVHLQGHYRAKYGHGPGSLPGAEEAGERIFSLPLYPRLTEEEQDDVVAALKRVIAAHRRAPAGDATTPGRDPERATCGSHAPARGHADAGTWAAGAASSCHAVPPVQRTPAASPSLAPVVSVVIPMLNEARNVAPLLDRLYPTMEAGPEPFEVICVDDGSTDDTLALLREQLARRAGLRVLSFARNFGQHAAVLAGFEAARGAWIVTLDADLQNPPEEVPRVVDGLRQGFDLVNTYREDRRDTLFRRVASLAVNRVMRRISGLSLRDFGCMLRGYHRDVTSPMVALREHHTFIPALALLHARRPTEIPVAHAGRAHGRSNYSLVRLLRLQLDLVTSFSLAPLRLLFSLGAIIALLGIGFGLTLLALRWLYGSGWAAEGVFTLFAVLFVFVGAQFFAFGVVGEYVGRIYQEVRNRPAFLVREEIAGGAGAGAAPAPGSPAARSPAEPEEAASRA